MKKRSSKWIGVEVEVEVEEEVVVDQEDPDLEELE